MDYYNPGLPFRETSAVSGSHALELNLDYSVKGFNISANYVLNEAGGVGSEGGDIYFQTGYEFDKLSLFAGGGNGWHTSCGGFNICNIGIGTERTIQITDRFSLLLSGQLIFNPDKDRLYLSATIAF